MTLRGIRILVIEDDGDVLGVYTILLRLEGAEVTGAGSGREALAHSRAGAFDLVLSDLGLPDIPGEMLIRVIRAAARQRLGVLVVTGQSEQSQTRAYEAGADVVFTKPLDWQALLASLTRLAPARAA